MTIDNELIDNLLKDYKKPEDIIGENGLLKQLTKQLLERAMAAELTEHVGYEKHDAAGHKSGNSRNGKSAKTLKGSFRICWRSLWLMARRIRAAFLSCSRSIFRSLSNAVDFSVDSFIDTSD